MPHINVISKREDVEYIDKIYLSDDHKVYVSLNTKTIFYEDEKGNVTKEPHPRNPGWWQMLEVLIRENERVVSSDDLYYTIYRDLATGIC